MAITKLPKLRKLKSQEIEPKNVSDSGYKWDPRPCVRFNSDEIPEIKDWVVGKEYTITMKVKMQEMSSREDESSKGPKYNGEFRVISVGVND